MSVYPELFKDLYEANKERKILAAVQMSHTKETKTGHRYDIEGEEGTPEAPWLKSFYLAKSKLKKEPKQITVIVVEDW